MSLLSLVIKQLLTLSLHSVCLIRPEVWRYGLGSHNVAAIERCSLLLAGSHAAILIQAEEEEGGEEEELNLLLFTFSVSEADNLRPVLTMEHIYLSHCIIVGDTGVRTSMELEDTEITNAGMSRIC